MKKLILSLLLLFSPLVVAVPVVALDPLDNNLVCNNNDDNRSSSAVCEDSNNARGNPITGSGGIIATIFTWLVRLTGVVSVIMIVIGGFKYVISGGDSSGVQSAKNTIIYAVVGLVVSGVAGLLIRFVVARLG